MNLGWVRKPPASSHLLPLPWASFCKTTICNIVSPYTLRLSLSDGMSVILQKVIRYVLSERLPSCDDLQQCMLVVIKRCKAYIANLGIEVQGYAQHIYDFRLNCLTS